MTTAPGGGARPPAAGPPAGDLPTFAAAAARALEGAEGHCAVVMLDIDGLRRINDALGRDAGDGILAALHDRLVEAAREHDVVGRIGGDAFAVLGTGFHTAEEARILGTRLTWAAERQYHAAGGQLSIRVAVGIAVTAAPVGDVARLLDDAAAALHAARRDGTGLVVYTEALREDSVRRFALHAALARALDSHGVSVHYQPLVEIASLRVVSAEALLRFSDPQTGPVSPADFVPVAEETGLIVPLGHWVLRAGLAQAARWREHGIAVGVNISARQLAQPDLVFQVRDALQESGAEPASVILEITESQVMRNLDVALPVMATLSDFGVQLAIDDFGTGYASLTQLKRIPAHELKLDRGFIIDLPGTVRDRAMVRAAIDMAHALEMKVVAEGVETVEQFDVLAELGCDIVQGFLLARPSPPEGMPLEVTLRR